MGAASIRKFKETSSGEPIFAVYAAPGFSLGGKALMTLDYSLHAYSRKISKLSQKI